MHELEKFAGNDATKGSQIMCRARNGTFAPGIPEG
jgi:hypothetical protein